METETRLLNQFGVASTRASPLSLQVSICNRIDKSHADAVRKAEQRAEQLDADIQVCQELHASAQSVLDKKFIDPQISSSTKFVIFFWRVSFLWCSPFWCQFETKKGITHIRGALF